MPRRKLSDPAPTKTRTRTGCQTCRHRKVKCDEKKPSCHNCTRRGLVCDNEFQLKWEVDYVSRGLAFGRQGIWSKREDVRGVPSGNSSHQDAIEWCPWPTIRPHHFLNTSVKDFQDGAMGDEVVEMSDEISLASPSITADYIPLGKAPSMFPGLLGTADTHLLDYYLQRLAPLTTPARVVPSPFATHIVPLFAAGESMTVLQAVLALAACHRSKTDPSWSQLAIRLKGNVLASLRRAMASRSMTQLVCDPHILVMMMFMCLYEINDDCDRRWVVHLRGSHEIIRQRRQLSLPSLQSTYDSLTSFTERFFAFQDVMGRTACGDIPLFGSDYWENLEPQIEVDAWMGCSPALARIICCITELSRKKPNKGDQLAWAQFARQAAALESDLGSLQRVKKSFDDQLAKSAELKRLSAVLYLHCALYDASPSVPFVVELVRQILQEVSDLLLRGVVAGLSFALFVTGVELDPLNDEVFIDRETGNPVYGRPLILAALDAMTASSVSNVSRTRAVIQKVWRMRDLHLQEDDVPPKDRTTAEGDGRLLNDWEYFVAPISANVSLA